jgi:hypothetical protein
MIIGAIIVGILLVLLILITIHVSDKKVADFEAGINMGLLISIFFIIEVNLLSGIIGDPEPTPMDVYRGKTTIEYKIVDGIKTDSIVVFKTNNYGK